MINVLIIGMGSVGKKYAELGLKNNFRVYFYDPKVDSVLGAEFFDIKNIIVPRINFEKIIFCDYAFTRVANYKKVRHLRPQEFIFEKLVANNREDIDFLRTEIAALPEVVFSTHLRWNILNLDGFLQNLVEKYSLGELCSMNVIGGNCCVSMGGAHWLGLFLSLFDVSNLADVNLLSGLEANYDSPRSQDIAVLSGTIFLSLKNGQTFNLNFSRNSHCAPSVTIICKHGSIEIDLYGNYKVFNTTTKGNQPTYRYFPEVLIEDGSFYENNHADPFEELLTRQGIVPLESGLNVSEIIIKAALTSSLYGKNAHHERDEHKLTLVKFT